MKISIIIPTLNAQSFICEAITSLLENDNLIGEIIIVDGGSKDSTKSLINKFKNNTSIKFFEVKNISIGAARNFGIEKAKFNYVGFLDSDDLQTQNYSILATTIDTVEANLDFVYGKHLTLDQEKAKLVCNYRKFKKENIYDEIFKSSLINLSSLIIKRDFLISNNIKFDVSVLGRYGEDWKFILDLIQAKPKFQFVDTFVSIVRIHTKSHSTGSTEWKMRLRTLIFLSKTYKNYSGSKKIRKYLAVWHFKTILYLLLWDRMYFASIVFSRIDYWPFKFLAILCLSFYSYFNASFKKLCTFIISQQKVINTYLRS